MNNKKKRQGRRYSYILHQIWNERRSNWAMMAELLIVSCVVWYLVDCAYVIVTRAMEPLGFDATNCYRLDVSKFDESSVGYDTAHPDSMEINIADFLALTDRLRHDADIEAVGYSWRNDPYQGMLCSNVIKYDTLKASLRMVICNPDFLKVFRYRGANGETPEQLAAMLKNGNVLLSHMAFGKEHDTNKMIGKEMKVGMSFGSNDTLPRRIAATFMPAKRFSWEETAWLQSYIMPATNEAMHEMIYNISLAIRVKENCAQGFSDRFRQKISGKQLRAGNYYVNGFHSYGELKRNSEAKQDTSMRYYTVAIVFLLVNVFLGLLGTFWLRTQHRFPEIGLQKAIGATNTDITLRLLTEAILMMTIAFLPSLIIDINIAHANLTEYYQGETLATGRFIICAAISYVLMLLVIALGIWFPALRATKANPADVLRGE
ncbi:MAG: ABC transporter permease [Prevotella sp.]|nr:ABC transporter permease [Prevotella sp.]